MKKLMKKALSAFLVSFCLISGSLYAFDFQAEYDSDDIAFKKELIYTISKTDALYRRFIAEGVTESLYKSVQSDERVLFLIMNEPRYDDFCEAIKAVTVNEDADEVIDSENVDSELLDLQDVENEELVQEVEDEQ